MLKKEPCSGLKDTPAYDYCMQGDDSGDDSKGGSGPPGPSAGITDGASDHVKDLASYLIKKLEGLIAPESTWAPKTADNWLYQQFLWLGQHLAVTIFICVIVVCALTAWQGSHRLKQMGASTGWTLAAVTAMGSVPVVVTALNKAVSAAFTTAFDSSEMTLFSTIRKDLKDGADSGHPLAILVIIAALVVALGFAVLVVMVRTPGMLLFVCMAPLVLGSLARGGDMSAVQTWAQRLLGLMFAPLALLLISPFVAFTKGSLVMDAVLLLAADVIMLRMIFHGVPYLGPRMASATRSLVEKHTSHPLARAAVKAGVPDHHEHENTPRGPRTVPTPGRAISQDRGVLLAAYGVKQRPRPGRLTTQSAISQINTDADRRNRLLAARRETRTTARPAKSPQPANTPRPDTT